MLQNIIFASIVILLLVVFVPAGAAYYQRLRAETKEREKSRARSAKEAERAASRAESAPLQAPATLPSRALEPPTTPPEATVLIPLATNDSVPQATAMIQWYGMLTCTSGALEGQKWMIDEDGLAIGREASLASIVINDSRISKRHLRLVPRDGKVYAIDESTNGTFLDSPGGERITERELKRGDTLVLAGNVATFVYKP